VRVAELRVRGIGCESCVLPGKEKALRLKGVRSVKVYGSLMEVEYDEKETDLGAIVKALEPFYLVTIESDRPLEQR
jgi:copper chaperone CopZ